MKSLFKTVDFAEFDLICDFCVEMKRRAKKTLAERISSALSEVKSKRIWDINIYYDD
jgi:hypothetical protein